MEQLLAQSSCGAALEAVWVRRLPEAVLLLMSAGPSSALTMSILFAGLSRHKLALLPKSMSGNGYERTFVKLRHYPPSTSVCIKFGMLCSFASAVLGPAAPLSFGYLPTTFGRGRPSAPATVKPAPSVGQRLSTTRCCPPGPGAHSSLRRPGIRPLHVPPKEVRYQAADFCSVPTLVLIQSPYSDQVIDHQGADFDWYNDNAISSALTIPPHASSRSSPQGARPLRWPVKAGSELTHLVHVFVFLRARLCALGPLQANCRSNGFPHNHSLIALESAAKRPRMIRLPSLALPLRHDPEWHCWSRNNAPESLFGPASTHPTLATGWASLSGA
jgi:hypothetical protein